MVMAHQGLLSWANSVRLTMVQDPGRQGFKDDVQRNGFLFLDDYLDNILSGAKQDPLIELVKTPGRKKTIARKPKLMSSKLGTVVSRIEKDDPGGENAMEGEDPISLLISMSQKQPEIKNHLSLPTLDRTTAPLRQPLAPIQPINVVTGSTLNQQLHLSPQAAVKPTGDAPATIQEQSKDLSIIAEDEEPSDRSHVSNSVLAAPLSSGSDPVVKPTSEAPSMRNPSSEEIGRNSNVSRQDDATTTSSSSMDTFHSIPLRSPPPPAAEELKKAEDFVTQNKTELHPPVSSNDEGSYSIHDFREDHLSTERKLNDKSVTPSFPTLPEPMPIRKSMKPPRDPSLNAVMTGAATPGGPLGGKRTSWLMKAREVKALEGGFKKPFAFATNILSSMPPVPQGTKRKSGEMSASQSGPESEERQFKIAKTEDNLTTRLYHELERESLQQQVVKSGFGSDATIRDPEPEEVLGILKKAVEGLGARSSKSMAKSPGETNAATILAEARSALDGRLLENGQKEEEKSTHMESAFAISPVSKLPESETSAERRNDARLSVSELFPKDARMKEKHKAPEKVFTFKLHDEAAQASNTHDSSKPRASTSTTPPNSPPPQQGTQLPQITQVFSKHTPVFVPPASVLAPVKPSNVFSPPVQAEDADSRNGLKALPSSTTLIPPPVVPLTAHSTLESVQSDAVFDRESISSWMPSTQDTDYTSYDNQTQSQNPQICDEDDSWPVDETLSAGVQWTFGGSKEDSMTWSTLPTQSQRGDTGPVPAPSPTQERQQEYKPSDSVQIPGAFDHQVKGSVDEQDVMMQDPELEEAVLGVSKATSSITESKLPPRSQSQMSVASSESSQSQLGFFGQASKLLSSALGTGKKKQPEVKAVLQKAAVAAKKQQEEADKKAARLKEMESRRQLALQRKAEEERVRALEEERKMKEDAERRKKEREGNTEKRTLKLPSAKKDEESHKKRKIEPEKKPEVKKLPPSVLLGKSHLKSAMKQTAANTSFAYGSLAYAASTSHLEAATPGTSKGKEKEQNVYDDDVSQPSQVVQSQMAARAKAQINAAKKVEPAIPSESIELPDINSEYSDSEDEDRVRTFDPPEWAQSPELRQALEMQSTINPDDIFGAVRPLRMEEIFKTRTSRFRARTSSANWSGSDRLTLQEEKEYARRMGFK